MEKSYIVGITGGSGSGKTYFLNRLLHAFAPERLCLVSQDNYYKAKELQPLDAKGIENFDLPDSIDHLAFAKDIEALLQGQEVERVEYTFNNAAATPRLIKMKPAPLIIVEGIFAFHFPQLNELINLKVFVDADEHIRLKRRIIRDHEERGYDLDDVLYRYEHHVSPTFQKYIRPYRNEADIVIPNNTGFSKGFEVLVAFLKQTIDMRQ